ncbi:MAG: hypothetical protein ACFFCW_39920 [Candidatus Hodarchaeota archaeon]
MEIRTLRVIKGGWENPKCLWEVFEKFTGECFKCDSLDPCLIDAVLNSTMGETKYLVFRKKIKNALKRADSIWKHAKI